MDSRQGTYGQNVAELEQIVESIKTGQVDVDVLAGKVARAKALIHECRRTLRGTSEAVARIVDEVDGELTRDGALPEASVWVGWSAGLEALERECPPEALDEHEDSLDQYGVHRTKRESIEDALNS